MDNLNQNTQTLEVTENAKMYLKTASSWTNFMAIINFIGIAIMALAGIILLVALRNPAMGVADVLSGGLYSYVGLFYIALAGIMVFPALYLLQFSQKMKKALASQDTLVMEDAFKKMKAYWKFTGILTIVVIALCIILFPVMAVIGASNSMPMMMY